MARLQPAPEQWLRHRVVGLVPARVLQRRERKGRVDGGVRRGRRHQIGDEQPLRTAGGGRRLAGDDAAAPRVVASCAAD
eukprot:3220028-Prymnesium_polylepis.1